MIIRRCKLRELEPYVKDAEALNLSFLPSAKYWLAEYESKIVGFIALSVKSNYAVSKSLYVLPEYRRRGIAKQLLIESLITAKLLGCKKVTANCLPASLNLYLSLGATVITEYKTVTKVEILL